MNDCLTTVKQFGWPQLQVDQQDNIFNEIMILFVTAYERDLAAFHFGETSART